MKKVWIRFKEGIRADERASIVEWVNRLVKIATPRRTIARFANASDQEDFDRRLVGYLGNGRPILLLTEDPDELMRILDADFPGMCTVADAPD